jgi:hypothetical protein
MPFRYKRSAERPSASIWWLSEAGSLIDFSTGYTFSLKVGVDGAAAVLTKTTGITGAAGAGTSPTGTPNVTVAWAAAELNLTPGMYTLELTATTGGLDRVLTDTIEILDIIT